jgi:hypothetical protein
MISPLRSPDPHVTSSEAVQTFSALSGERRATGLSKLRDACVYDAGDCCHVCNGGRKNRERPVE